MTIPIRPPFTLETALAKVRSAEDAWNSRDPVRVSLGYSSDSIWRNALAQSKESAMAQHTSYRTVKVDGLSIFYREAGPRDAPTLLLLHGFPSSSRMFEPLFARLPHPNLGSDVNPAEIHEWVCKHAPSNMEGVFIAGNGFRAIGVIAALEEDLGRPVLTGNQVAFWYALRLAGVGAQVDNYGQVFKKKPNRK